MYQDFRIVGLALYFLVFTASCAAPTQWIKPGTSAALTDQALATCQLDAERNVWESGDSEKREGRLAHWVGLCMRSNGWQKQIVQ